MAATPVTEWDAQGNPVQSSAPAKEWDATGQPIHQAALSLTANPKGEGTYSMWDDAGRKLQIPYSQVPVAHGKGYQFDTNPDPRKDGLTPAQAFTRDESSDPNRSGGTSLLMQPKGQQSDVRPEPVSRQESIQRTEDAEKNASLPARVLTGVAKGGATLARPAIDIMNLGANGNTPAEQNAMLQGRTPAETAAKVGTIGATIVPGAIAAPLAAAASMGAGALGGVAGHMAGNAMGLTPQQTEVLSDATGLAGGVAGGLTPRLLPSAAQRFAPRVYGSALKPPTTLSAGDRASVIKTGLQNEIPVSAEGLSQLGNKIDVLNQQIKSTIASDPNRPIDPNAVATRADIAKARFANQVNAQPDLDAIEAARQQFLTEQGAQPGKPGIPPRPTGLLDAQGNPIMSQGTPATPPQPAPPMGAADAQAMKQGTYRVLKGKFGEQGSASVEAQKSLARGLKEEIAGQFPELSNLNAQESKMLDLQPLLERAVNRISNHNIIGIGTPIAGGAVKAVSGSTPLGVIATVIKAAVDDPMVKSRLAISLSKSANVPYSTALARIQAYSASLGSTAANSLVNPSAASQSQSPNGQP